MMRFLIAAGLVLSCGLCLAKDLPEDTWEIKSLTPEQAAELVGKSEVVLDLANRTLIDKQVAQEFAKFAGEKLRLGLT
jgi:hypothetical protein